MTCARTLEAPRWLGKKRGSCLECQRLVSVYQNRVVIVPLTSFPTASRAKSPSQFQRSLASADQRFSGPHGRAGCCGIIVSAAGGFSSASPICSLHKENWGGLRGSLRSPGFKPQPGIAGFFTTSTPMRATWQSDRAHGPPTAWLKMKCSLFLVN